MKKNSIFSLTFLIFSSISYAQVGIQTAYPKGTFHVDGNKDNPKDGTTVVSPAQQANDFIVQSTTGNVGIGTNQPQTKLVVNDGTSNQAILIKDGNQGEGKYLMSDANGLATWKIPNSFKSAITWKYDGTNIKVSNNIPLSTTGDNIGYYEPKGSSYSHLTLTGLTKGKWIVSMGIRLKTQVELANAFWIHAKLSSSNTGVTSNGFTNLGPAGNATGYAGVVFGDGSVDGRGFLSGTSIIEVTSINPINIFLFLENIAQWDFETQSPENYFYAIPIN